MCVISWIIKSLVRNSDNMKMKEIYRVKIYNILPTMNLVAMRKNIFFNIQYFSSI